MLTGQIQLLFAIYGLSFGFFTWLCEKAAGKIGRVQAGDGEATLRVVPKKPKKTKCQLVQLVQARLDSCLRCLV